MTKQTSSKLYNASRKIGKAASILNDIETLATGNPKKITKRLKRKIGNKIFNKIRRKVIKWASNGNVWNVIKTF